MAHQFRAEDAEILGVSVDSLESHRKWAKETGLSRCIGHGGFVHGWGFGADRTPYLLITGRTALYLSIVLSGLVLFGVGFVKGRLAAKSPARSGAQFFAIAVGAALLGYLIGLVVQHFFPDVSIPV